MIKVYVAGPYTKGDVALNVREAILVGDVLATHGFAPFVPHLTHFWHIVAPRTYQFWVDLDLQFLPACDALLRIAGDSPGSDHEEAVARELEIPVFYDIESLIGHFGVQEGAGL